MKISMIFAVKMLIILLLLQSCEKKEEVNPPDTNNPTTPTAPPTSLQSLTGNPALNKFIVTSTSEEVVTIDANTGAHEVLFSFEAFTDVVSIDYLDGIMYVGADDNSANAIDVASKKLLWDIPLLAYNVRAVATQQVMVKDGVCYAVGDGGVLVAADRKTGKPLWAYPLDPTGATDGYFPSSSITLTEDKLIIGSMLTIVDEGERNYVYVFDRASGKLLWRKALPPDKWVSGSMRIAGNTLLVPANHLYALDLGTGTTLWEVNLQHSQAGRGAGTPVVAGNSILIHGAKDIIDGRLYCLDLRNGQKIWEIDAGTSHVGRFAPLIVGNLVLGIYDKGASDSADGRPFVADVATGKIIWSSDEVSVATSPVYANGRLFFHGQNFKGTAHIEENVGILCLEAATGKFLWLNNYPRHRSYTSPVLVAENGIFQSGHYAAH
jgi:outer membrane protein assembly factor BamB